MVLEDDYVCCILDHNPYNEGHVLILSKNHIRYFDELDENTANSIIKASRIITKAIKKLFNPDGITVCQNGGAFDELTHFHMHIVPRYEGQNFADFYTEDGETNIEEENRLKETKRKIIDSIKVLD
ncbi:HIT family protein [Metabacillus halosaccharovorans]|uniref:HIT family protein n=1 Tax=Metabacillus halosaccharovorans TaxID=930124 RepID=UPI001C1F8BC8|nr:HIT family protein [Metabacillus halosaccharovorans]